MEISKRQVQESAEKLRKEINKLRYEYHVLDLTFSRIGRIIKI